MRIGVIGAGAWGTTLANLLAEKGYDVGLWACEKEVCGDIVEARENKVFLPGSHLVFRSVAVRWVHHPTERTLIVNATKGIENETHLTMSGILEQLLPPRLHGRIAVLSGPSFAKEVAKQIPTAVTIAARTVEVAQQVQTTFATSYFRVYTSYDVVGAELGGAVKNVMAIAAGISDGLGLGYNTRAALITRGVAEIQRLATRLGANPKTFMGLAGIGDLVLTCTGKLSRNWTVGHKLGQGMKLEAILSETRTVAEGVRTTKSVYNLSRKIGVEMPIAEQIYRILYEDLEPKEALHVLMSRDLRQEMDEE